MDPNLFQNLTHESSATSQVSRSIPTSRKSGISAAAVFAASAITSNLLTSNDLDKSTSPLYSPGTSPTIGAQPISFKSQNRKLSGIVHRYNHHESGAASPTNSLSSSIGSHRTQLSSIIFAKDSVDGHDVVLKTSSASSSSKNRVEFEGFSEAMNGNYIRPDDSEKGISVSAEKEFELLNELAEAGVKNVVRPKDSYIDENGAFTLVMPVLKKFNPGDMDLLTIRNRLKELLTILASVHAHNIVHLDVTPANIMLNPDTEELMLIDFGLACRCNPAVTGIDHRLDLDASTGSLTFDTTHLDQSIQSLSFLDQSQHQELPALVDPTHAIDIDDNKSFQFPPHPRGCGTPGYISPEVYAGTATTYAPDIFAAGVIAGHWLDPYLPNFSLHLLGSRLIRPGTTTEIAKKLRNFVRSGRRSQNPTSIISPPSFRAYADTRSESSGNLLLHQHFKQHDRVSILRNQSMPKLFSHSSSCPALSTNLGDDLEDAADVEIFQDAPISSLVGTSRSYLSLYSHEDTDDELLEKARHPMTLMAADLLWRMLHPVENRRISASAALEHPFLTALEEEFRETELEEWTKRLDMRRGFCGEGWKTRGGGGIGPLRDRVRVMYR